MGLNITGKKGSCCKLTLQTDWLDQTLRHAQCRSQENACDLERSLQSPSTLPRSVCVPGAPVLVPPRVPVCHWRTRDTVQVSASCPRWGLFLIEQFYSLLLLRYQAPLSDNSYHNAYHKNLHGICWARVTAISISSTVKWLF